MPAASAVLKVRDNDMCFKVYIWINGKVLSNNVSLYSYYSLAVVIPDPVHVVRTGFGQQTQLNINTCLSSRSLCS